MPEDLEDKLDDFELMLEGFISKLELDQSDRGEDRVLGYWYALKEEIKGAIDAN
jgi:hypothetical protein